MIFRSYEMSLVIGLMCAVQSTSLHSIFVGQTNCKDESRVESIISEQVFCLDVISQIFIKNENKQPKQTAWIITI